jgi:hypothetical protein
MAGNRSRWTSGLLTAVALATAGCGSVASGPGTATSSTLASSGGSAATDGPLPPGVMSAARACRQVIDGRWRGRLFTGVEQVHLVLTTYAKGEPVASRGDISYGMPPRTLVWIVEVHAKTVKTDYFTGPAVPSVPSGPSSSHSSVLLTDYSAVMNARTGLVADSGACNCWPLPLSKVGTVVSLPPQC